MQRLNTFLLASTVALLTLVFGLAHALKQHPPYAPQVYAQQQTDSALKGQENAKGSAQQAAPANEERGGKHPEQGENEGTEFWPTFLGIRLKITDSLLAAFTFGLLIFNGLLWRSTDKLWAAGERQLKLAAETSAAQSRDMQASVAASTAAVDVAKRSFLAEHGTWLKVYPTVIGPIRFTNGKARMEVTIEAENIGRNPAIAVHLGCSMFRTRGFGIGDEETSASLDQTKGFASLGGLGRDLLPGEKMNIRFAADPEIVQRLEERVRDQVTAGIPESNFAPILNAAFSAIWKSTVSEEWRHSAFAVVISVKDKGPKMDILDGEIPSEKLSCILVPGESQLAG